MIKKLFPLSLRLYLAGFWYGFFGPYDNWTAAKNKSTGYDSGIILDKVKSAILKVKSGEAAFERDSALFFRHEYNWPLLACLFCAAGENGNKLDVLDFGGSLGSSYFQNRPMLKHLNRLSWNVVEQSHFVACGKEHFEDNNLHFYGSIRECLENNKPSIIVFSSVIQYLERPYDILKDALEAGIKYIFIDRTAVTPNSEDFVALQKVPPQIYQASYPCWFLSEKKLLDYLCSKYELLSEFDSPERPINKSNIKGKFKGFILRIKE